MLMEVDEWTSFTGHFTHLKSWHTGKDLIISRDYIAQGMRERAAELATEWETQQGLQREVEQERWTSVETII